MSCDWTSFREQMMGMNKNCPNLREKGEAAIFGLQHCKCGISRHRVRGCFERTNNMVFALECQKIGKKIKQISVTQRKADENV